MLLFLDDKEIIMKINVLRVILLLIVAGIAGTSLKAGQNILPDKYFDIDIKKISYDDIIKGLKGKGSKYEDTYVYEDRIVIADTFVGNNIEKKYVSRVVYYLRGLDDLYLDIEIEIPKKYYHYFFSNFYNNIGESLMLFVDGKNEYYWSYSVVDESSFFLVQISKKSISLFDPSLRKDLKSREDMFYILLRGKSRLPKKKIYTHPVD